jgi:hypothetical protein
MSDLEISELERLSDLFALGSLENAQEIVELLRVELGEQRKQHACPGQYPFRSRETRAPIRRGQLPEE